MARIKRAQIRKKRVKKLFKRSKGFFMSRNNTLRQANEAVMKARMNAYTGRKQKNVNTAQCGLLVSMLHVDHSKSVTVSSCTA